jgi:endonuclease/exonuclease/phosphatase family metal-dependent hydrolase
VLVAGDFNDWTERAGARLTDQSGLSEVFLSGSGAHAPTFPSVLPVLKLDRIYFRNLELVQARVLKGKPWNSLSDHAPVQASFKY